MRGSFDIRVMAGTIALASTLLAGCACESGIDISGDGDSDTLGDTAGDTSSDTNADDTGGDTTIDPVFDPPYDGFGETGWRDSTVPLCRPPIAGELTGRDVWSDPRGVFMLVDVGIADGTRTGVQRALFMNDGSEWSMAVDLFLDEGEYTMFQIDEIAGVPGGPIFGWSGSALFSMDPASGTTARQAVGLDDIFVVDDTLAYGILTSDPGLIVYDGVSWGPYPGDPIPFDVHRVWADHDVVFCAGYSGIILSTSGSGWTVHGTRTLNDFRAIWGFSETDVWAGTSQGTLHHWNGTDWAPVEWPNLAMGVDRCDSLDPQPIDGMWGKDGVLFFHTGNQLLMWDGAEFTVLAYWPGSASGGTCLGALGIHEIWGNSANELFIVVQGPEYPTGPGTCPEYLLWWDGSEFHWF